MKIRCLISILFTILSAKTFAQEIQLIDSTKWLCTYKYEFLQDSTSKNSLKQVNMILEIGSFISKYSEFSSYLSDSMLYIARNTEFNEANSQLVLDQIMKMTSGINSNLLASNNIYKNYPQKGSMFFKGYDDHKFFKVVQPMQMKWKLDAMKDTVILGYRCQRACTSFAGRDYTAWYTTQIPLSEGPYKFNGLPGLIVKIYDSKNQHRFTLTSVKKLKYNRPITFSKNNYIDITAEEYVKILMNKMARYYGRVQSGDITINSDEVKAKSLQGLKTKNNFIEKY